MNCFRVMFWNEQMVRASIVCIHRGFCSIWSSGFLGRHSLARLSVVPVSLSVSLDLDQIS